MVPLEIRDEDKAIRGIRVLIHNPVGFGFLVKNVVHPLGRRKQRDAHRMARASSLFLLPGL